MLDPVKRSVIRAARLFRLPAEWLLVVAYIESRFNPDAVNKVSGAKGLFQFVKTTAIQYGISPLDPEESSAAAAMMMARNRRSLQSQGIADPTLTDLYLCHQQGLGGFSDIYRVMNTGGSLNTVRIENMRANVGPECQLKAEDMDQAKARRFYLYWAGRLGMVQVLVRKDLGRP